MAEEKRVIRYEDMSRRGRLVVFRQDDGDVIVQVVPDPHERDRHASTAEFCTPGTGGGQSVHTHKALISLIDAIERDNEERPQDRDG